MTTLNTADAEFVTFVIDGRWFGARVEDVQDVFKLSNVTPVPKSRPDIAGLLNLRGRIVTAIDARKRLDLDPREGGYAGLMAIGIERDGEPYALVVDGVGEVARLPDAAREDPPSNLNETWREVALGVYRLEKSLILVVDVRRLIDPPGAGAEALAA